MNLNILNKKVFHKLKKDINLNQSTMLILYML